jgi:hypothetical protein
MWFEQQLDQQGWSTKSCNRTRVSCCDAVMRSVATKHCLKANGTGGEVIKHILMDLSNVFLDPVAARPSWILLASYLLVLRKLDPLLHWWPGGWHQKFLISQMSERWTQDPSPSSHSASQCILWLVSVVSSSMHPWETTMIAGENRLTAALSHLRVSADLTKDWAIAVGHVKAMKFIDYVYWCPAIVFPQWTELTQLLLQRFVRYDDDRSC